MLFRGPHPDDGYVLIIYVYLWFSRLFLNASILLVRTGEKDPGPRIPDSLLHHERQGPSFLLNCRVIDK